MNTIIFSSLLDQVISPYSVEQLTKSIHQHSDFQIQFVETKDIWCRDFMPIQVGRNKFIHFSLAKDYYPKRLNNLRTDPLPICESLGIEPSIPIIDGHPIYLDGGNVIRKFNKVIITDKVFKDNDIPFDDLRIILKDLLEVDQVIIIPREPGEDSGHSDGMVRFVSEDSVLINDYSSVDTDRRFVKKLYRTLKESGLSIIKVPYNPVDERINRIQPATGIYVNFLQVENKIFLPTFNDPSTDSQAISVFKEIFGADNVIPVPSFELSLLGGVLNCISWEINDQPIL